MTVASVDLGVDRLLPVQLYRPTADLLHSALSGDRAAWVRVRGLNTLELSPATVVYGLGEFPDRVGMSKRLGLVEGLMLVAGSWDQDAVEWAAPSADIRMFGPMARYGPRVRRQLDPVVDELRRDPASRRAVLTLPRPLEAGGGDAPCTTSLQLLVRGGRLDLVATMRSTDAVLGLPTDALSFGVLGLVVARALGVEPGRLTLTTGSLHVYGETSAKLRGNRIGRIGLAGLALPAAVDWPTVRRWAARTLKRRDLLWLPLSSAT